MHAEMTIFSFAASGAMRHGSTGGAMQDDGMTIIIVAIAMLLAAAGVGGWVVRQRAKARARRPSRFFSVSLAPPDARYKV